MGTDKALCMLQEDIGDFTKELSAIDELTQAVLKGHLLIERDLDEIIALLFFHPEYILQCRSRFGFDRKVALLRALVPRTHELPVWEMMAAVNELRNVVAHSLSADRRKEKMDAVRQLYLSTTIDPDIIEVFRHAADHLVAISVYGICGGFLDHLKEDMTRLRERINELVAQPGNYGDT